MMRKSVLKSGLSRAVNNSSSRFLSSKTLNQQYRLAKRPVGATQASDWNFTEEPIKRASEDGDIVVKVSTISLDPAMRGWLNDAKSYVPPVAIGEVMRAIGVGRVEESKNPKFKEGDYVTGLFGVQTYATLGSTEIKRGSVTKIDLRFGSEAQWLNVLGMPGMTAFFGLNDIGQPKAGETIVISAASGAVGQTVGQLAKIKGLRVVGIAGGKTKCDFTVKNLGFDACIDYKESPSAVRAGLKEHCPQGVDIYFDSVGGEILDTVLTKINRKARIIICGAISQYNNTSPVVGPSNCLSLLVNRARMEGIVVFDFAEKYPIAVQELAGHLKTGKMQSKEDIETGIKNFPDVLNKLFAGKNFGKLILKVDE
jgi:NADPH-dependent curcumin reductase CurA